MKILVISDNHGNMSSLEMLADMYKEQIDMVIHCGDSERNPAEIQKLFGLPCYVAEGNCDYFSSFGEDETEHLIEVGDHVCFITHGHRQGASWGEEELVEKALELGADLVFYGHTHRPAYSVYDEEGVTVLNPGSISLPRQYPPKRTFLIVEVDDSGEIKPNFYEF